MRPLVLLFLLALLGTAFYLLQAPQDPGSKLEHSPGLARAASSSSADGHTRLSAGESAQSSQNSQRSTLTNKQAAQSSADDKAGASGRPQPGPAQETAMSSEQRREVEGYFSEIRDSALPDDLLENLMQEYPQAFGELPEAEQARAMIRAGLHAFIGQRLGMHDPAAKASQVHGKLPLAEQAYRSFPEAVREGNVKFRVVEDGIDGKTGVLPGKKTKSRHLLYRWRKGPRVLEMEIDRNTTPPEFLDLFDPERRQG